MMKSRMAIASTLFCAAVAPAQGTPEASDPGPAAFGFQHYYKCEGADSFISLGDTGTPQTCLAQCLKLSRGFLDNQAGGCWWLDGTGGFKRECRVCKGTEPVKESYPNDWARPLKTGPSA